MSGSHQVLMKSGGGAAVSCKKGQQLVGEENEEQAE